MTILPPTVRSTALACTLRPARHVITIENIRHTRGCR